MGDFSSGFISSWAGLYLHSLTNPTHIVSRLGLDAHQASAIDAVASRGPLLWQAPRFASSQPSPTAVHEELAMLMRLELRTGATGSSWVGASDRSSQSSNGVTCTPPEVLPETSRLPSRPRWLDPENSRTGREIEMKRVYGLLILLRWSLPSRFAWLIAPNQLELRTGSRRHRHSRPAPRPRS